MSDESIPETLTIPLSAAVNLGIEYWRLTRSLAGDPKVAISANTRYALRKMEDFLKQCELTIQQLDGHPFDAGLAVRVVDTVDDPGLPKDKMLIDETVSPLVMWRGQVVKSADVVTRKGTK